MSEPNRVEGEFVLCHRCDHRWHRSQGGLVCPNCESDFVEILSNPSTPESLPQLHSAPASRTQSPPLPPHPFHNHNPWQGDASDPEEDDITTIRFNTGGGRGMFSFTTRTFRAGNMRNVMNEPAPIPDPELEDLAFNFEEMLTNIMGEQTRQGRGFPDGPMMPPFFFGGPQSRGGFGGIAAGAGRMDANTYHTQQFGNMNDLFAVIWNTMNQPGFHGPNGPEDAQPHPLAMLGALLNPANARHGDAVFSQEAFDRVMSQLMEQNQGSTAPGPASEAAINALPTKAVAKDMMGSDGKAECSICMDNVELGEEVTVLPCNHWFHGQCVTAWLKEHDTCPHCRKPITPEHATGRQASNSRRRSSRRSSSVASPVSPAAEASRRNPFIIPETPSQLRQARQQYYGSRRDRDNDRDDYERSRSHRYPSHSEPRDSRQGSRSGGGGTNGGGGGSGGGGVTGWIRNHLPFQ